MAVTYLIVHPTQSREVKRLGALLDPDTGEWYAPAGADLALFAPWLPQRAGARGSSATVAAAARTTEVATIRDGAVRLSQLLAGVGNAVSAAYRTGVWTMVEVLQVAPRGGHVYLEVAERSGGQVLAKARANIWANVANSILPKFEQKTGMVIGPGIKLLVRAKPTFHSQYGFSLNIDAIDPEYTLGDLEARKREIRARLQAEGVWDANRLLAAPWDFEAVLVVAPDQAAGLGDFQAEANRLAAAGVCQFVYAASRFQGEGAGSEICAAAQAVLDDWPLSVPADAIAIIRGGGAASDLAWLNEYCLARFVCDAPVPVFTGIGHERDSTVVDEVAHTRFDTPSKVILGIERVIRARAAEGMANCEAIMATVKSRLHAARSEAEALYAVTERAARRSIVTAKERAGQAMQEISVGANRAVRTAGERNDRAMFQVRELAGEELALARRAAPALRAQVATAASAALASVRSRDDTALQALLERTGNFVQRAHQDSDRALRDVAHGARAAIAKAGAESDALMREIVGQSPSKTLARGFALVRAEDGSTVTSAERARAESRLSIEFEHGKVHVTPEKE
jgi:exodeoxyribonuclease VII large subunit